MATSTDSSKTVFSILFAISIAHLLNDAVQSVIPSIYPILKDDFGLTFTQIGIITFVFQMTSSILQPFVGRYADRHPSPFALTCGMCISLTGLVLLAFSDSFAFILGSDAASDAMTCGHRIAGPTCGSLYFADTTVLPT